MAFAVLFAPILFLPAFLFRYSMKAGAWIWLPLVWILKGHDAKEPALFLDSEGRGFWAHFRLVYALFVFGVLTVGVILFAGVVDHYGWGEGALGMLFLFGLAKLWTWTRAGAALLFIISYVSSRIILRAREKREEPEYGELGVRALWYLANLRSALGFYTLIVSVWLVGTELIPWDVIIETLRHMEVFPGLFVDMAPAETG